MEKDKQKSALFNIYEISIMELTLNYNTVFKKNKKTIKQQLVIFK